MFGRDDPQLQPVAADIHEERSIADAIAGAYGVVNAVSLYIERANDTFDSVHVKAAKRVAAQAHIAGVKRLIHVSGIGADATSQSIYIRKRGEGELAVRAAFPNSVLFRPAVMFGPDDAFLSTGLELLRRLPVYPMFGGGVTRLQPVYVEDVAEGVTTALERVDADATTFECGGPRVYTVRGIFEIGRPRSRAQAHSPPYHNIARARCDSRNRGTSRRKDHPYIYLNVGECGRLE